MNKRITIYTAIFTSALIVFLSILIYSKRRDYFSLEVELSACLEKNSTLKNKYLRELQMNSTSVDPYFKLIDKDEDTLEIGSILCNQERLFLYIPETACSSCAESELLSLASIDSSTLKKSITIITNHSYLRDFHMFCKLNEIYSQIYVLVDCNSLGFNGLQNLCYFSIDNNYSLKNVYIVDNHFLAMKERYLDIILNNSSY